MKMMYIGAASLLALGMAACGENAETEYAEEDEAEDSSTYAEDETATDETGATDPYDTAAANDPAAEGDALDPYGDETDVAEAPIGQEPAGTAASLQPVSMTFAEVETEEDLSELVDNAFQQADVDQNGQLSREEFQILTASLAPTDMAQPSGAASTEDETAMDTEAQGDAAAGTETADVAAEERIFAEAAGTGDAVEKESLREAFLARFETADMDGDDRLDPQEREEFVRIALGGDASAEPPAPEQNQ